MCLGVFSAYYGDRAIPHWVALLAAQFHFLAVVLGVSGLRRWSEGEAFGNIRWLMFYLFFAGIVVPFLTTGPIDLLRWYSGADNVRELAIRSFLCISLGVILGTPAFYFAVRERHLWRSAPSYRRLAEVLIVFAALIVVSHFAFNSTPGTAAVPALMYSPLPFLLWAAMRFGCGRDKLGDDHPFISVDMECDSGSGAFWSDRSDRQRPSVAVLPPLVVSSTHVPCVCRFAAAKVLHGPCAKPE